MKIAPVDATSEARRPPLTRERVLEAAVQLADREGIEALSMRRLALELGIEAMSLYTHVRNKEDLLDGMVEFVVGEIPIGRDDIGWKASLREMVMSAREVLLRHRWAPRVIETRVAPGPVMLGYYDAVIGTLRRGGFSLDLTHHALHMLGSRMLGFTQDLFDDSPPARPDEAANLAAQIGHVYPYVAELALAATHGGALGGCDDDLEFEFALDVILDGLERLHKAG